MKSSGGLAATDGGTGLETDRKIEEQIRNEDLQRVTNFRWIDDTFARVAFGGHAKLGEFVLRTITRLDDLIIDEKSFETQYDAKRLAGSRSLMLDVRGIDLKGRKYDLEMEKWDASPERAEVHGAAMVVEHLHKGDRFRDLNETYVIFMCEHDAVGNGRAVNQFSFRNDDFVKENVGYQSVKEYEAAQMEEMQAEKDKIEAEAVKAVVVEDSEEFTLQSTVARCVEPLTIGSNISHKNTLL